MAAALPACGVPSTGLRGLLLAAFIVGALGVLIDVTVTQAAAVAELHDRAGLSGRALFASGSAVGRSHIGASINTLFLAYAGASLPVLLVLAASAQPLILTLNSETTASELVRTIVGSVGLLAAVPATTAITTILLASSRDEASTSAGAPTSRGWLLRLGGIGAASAIVLALALVAGSMAGTPPHPAAPAPDVFAPPSQSNEPAPSIAPGKPTDTSQPGASDQSPPVYEIGQRISLAELGGQPVTIVVRSTKVTDGQAGARTVEVELEFTSSVALDIAPADWRLLTDHGSEYTGSPDESRDRPLTAATLTPDQPFSGWLEFSALSTDQSGFLEFVSSNGNPLFLVSVF